MSAGGRKRERQFLVPNYSDPDDFFTPHVGTAFFLFADGSVRPVSVKTDVDIIRALATRHGGEIINPNDY
jgi:prepilin-type processing-associated H-X9-DG protein